MSELRATLRIRANRRSYRSRGFRTFETLARNTPGTIPIGNAARISSSAMRNDNRGRCASQANQSGAIVWLKRQWPTSAAAKPVTGSDWRYAVMRQFKVCAIASGA
jgi:hypothetical protein